MHKNNVPIKVAIGYCAIAIVLVLAISLVYSNTKSIIAINQASREYIHKRDAADSTMSALLKEEQNNLRQLNEAMEGKATTNYLHDKVENLNKGKDSVMVHTKAPQTQEAKHTTVEVVKTRKGFFRRLADAFRKEHAETISVKRDSNKAVIDSVATPVNVAENVADILEQIEKKEKHTSQKHSENINKEMEDLKMLNAKMALRSAKQLNDYHKQERGNMQQAINKAMEARRHLLWQIGMLAIVAILASIVLLWYIWQDTRKERQYREDLEAANEETQQANDNLMAANEEIKQANEEIKRIMSQRKRLLLTITHDIKAPAASISGFIDLMKDYVSDPEGVNCLGNIKNSATHLSKLVASLLDYHQLENGLMKTHIEPFLPAQLVAESVEGMRLRAEEKGLKIAYKIEDEQENKKTFEADAFRIRQILDNLVSNAIKYTEQGSISIEATIKPSASKPSYLLTLSVKDTGKGMTSEEKQKVFQAFTRLKSAQGIEGTGLGLSITKELVSLLDGEIHVESEVGKGSTFTVVLPILASSENPKEDSGTKDSPKGNSEKDDSQKRNPGKDDSQKKILVLDDDKLQLQLLQKILHKIVGNTWQVFACNHVTEALTILHNEQPTLMLTDIEMPEMNGTELIKHINHTNMTVIAMTAHDESIKPQLLEAGFDDCLFKPFTVDDLKEFMEKKLGRLEEKPWEEKEEEEKSKIEKPSIPARFAPLLTFAEGDEEAAWEIYTTVKQELIGYQQRLTEALSQTEETKETVLSPASEIGKIAHKLLPLATMLNLESIEQIKALSPEHIQELDALKIKEYTQTVITELKEI